MMNEVITEKRDPVCGMTVKAGTPHVSTHDGEAYAFCSARCLEKFRADPKKFSGEAKAEPSAQPVTKGVTYTCPMHPEIERDAPGSCPKCGMALEPRSTVADEGDSAYERPTGTSTKGSYLRARMGVWKWGEANAKSLSCVKIIQVGSGVDGFLAGAGLGFEPRE